MSAQRMGNADAAWLHMDRPTNLMVVNAVLWTDEPVAQERARALLRERLVDRFPRFRQRVVEPQLGIGGPYWEDDPHFHLDRHIHTLALPAPGDQAALQRLVADLMAVPLTRSKPLWDAYVVEGYGSGTALITRMHHCIADGIALARVLLSLTDEQPDAGIAQPVPARRSRGRVGTVTGTARTGAHLAEAALHEGFEVLAHPTSEVRRLAGAGVADARALAKLLLTMPDTATPLRGELGGSQRVTWTDPISLADVKAIGRATGTTVNDVLVAAVAGALHRYLNGRGSDAEHVRAMIPFNLRPLDEPLPRDLGNRFGLVYLDLPVGPVSARERLGDVHRRMEAIKHSPEGPIAYAILGAMGMAPPQVEARMIDVFTPKVTLVLTNVPGPRQPVYFAGARVAGVLGWVPAAGGIGMGVCIFSYAGEVTIGVRADAGLVPDPEAIVDGIAHELEALKPLRATLRPRRRPGIAPRRPQPVSSGRSGSSAHSTSEPS